MEKSRPMASVHKIAAQSLSTVKGVARLLLPCLALPLACFSSAAQISQPQHKKPDSTTPMDTTVCMVADNENSIGAQILRVRGQMYWLFNELVIRDKGCRLVLELPSATTAHTEGQQDSAAVPRKNIASGTNDDPLHVLLRYVNARVAPIRKDAACLVCGRYRVRATIVGQLQPRTRPKSSRTVEAGSAHNRSSKEKRSSRHLVIEAVSNVSAIDLYGKLYSPDKYKLVPTE